MKKLLLAATVCIAIAPATASAQSWGRGGAYTGAGSNEVVRTTNQGYYPRTGSHSCNWSVAASCPHGAAASTTATVFGINWSDAIRTEGGPSGCSTTASG